MTKKNLLKPFPFAFHVILWIIYLVWAAGGNVTRFGISHLFVMVLVTPVILGLAYLHRFWFRRLFVNRQMWGKMLVWPGVLFLLLGAAIYILLYKQPLYISKLILPEPEGQRFSHYLLDFVDFYMKFAGVGIGLATAEIFANLLRDRVNVFKQKRKDIAVRQKKKKLKQWITHFAGNISNGTVYSMKKEVNPRQVSASVAINGYIVRLLTRDNIFWVSLKEELYYLQEFRAMFNAFPIQLTVPTETYQHQVLPLSLLVLYKNMCKHGAFEKDTATAHFCVTVTQSRLLIVTQNTIMPDALWIYQEGGTGLLQLKGLLSDNHGERVTLEYGLERDRFRLQLEILYPTELYHQKTNNYGTKTTCIAGDGYR